MGALKRAGLITVARGTGGAELARPPRKSLCSISIRQWNPRTSMM
ncbi:hypothetical protein L1K07_04825 [Bifidobacterium longum]|nr:hypothetical protein [Bifidobacterium longum]MDG5953396.1 hypothetical protein [Bifidobacterium longum]